MTSQPFPIHATVCEMDTGLRILAVELDGDDGIVVTFSDGTNGGYVIEELLALRPVRERVKVKTSPGAPIHFSSD